MRDKRTISVHAKHPLSSDTEAAIDALADAILAKDEYRDMLGIPRIGREPDFQNGRWCVHCVNSLPVDWTGPCDVYGAQTSVFVSQEPRTPCESHVLWPSKP